MARSIFKRLRRWVMFGLLATAAILTASAAYQAWCVRSLHTRYPPPGRLVDIGGRRLHLVCIGEGAPTVIFEASGFGNALSSSKARDEIATKTQVCSYDRLGTGWSDPGPETITIGTLADDLAKLIERAPLRPPFVLVASSIGGVTAELFARRHSEQVAGLVFLDPATSKGLERALPLATPANISAVCAAKMAARLGLLRLVDPFSLRASPLDADRAMALMYRPEPMATGCGLAHGLRASLDEFRVAPALRFDVPMTVLTAETLQHLLPMGFEPPANAVRDRKELHQILASQSSHGTWRVVPGSDHLIASSQPHAVATAVLEMIATIR